MKNKLNWERQWSYFQDNIITFKSNFKGLMFRLETNKKLSLKPYWRLWMNDKIISSEIYGEFESVKIEAENNIKKYLQYQIDNYSNKLKKLTT